MFKGIKPIISDTAKVMEGGAEITRFTLNWKRQDTKQLKTLNIQRFDRIKEVVAARDAVESKGTTTEALEASGKMFAATEQAEVSTLDSIKSNLAGWSGVLDDQDSPVDFSLENLESMLAIPEYLTAVSESYHRFIDGKCIMEQATKNLETSADTGSSGANGSDNKKTATMNA